MSSVPLLFKRLKEEIVRLKDAGRVLMRFNELRETLQLRLLGEVARFSDEELKAVVSLLAGPGVVWELKFGSWVLLQPERINAYAQAVIQTMRAVVRLRHYVCPHCGTPVGNREVAMKRLEAWLEKTAAAMGATSRLKGLRGKPQKPTIICVECEKRVPL